MRLADACGGTLTLPETRKILDAIRTGQVHLVERAMFPADGTQAQCDLPLDADVCISFTRPSFECI